MTGAMYGIVPRPPGSGREYCFRFEIEFLGFNEWVRDDAASR